MFTIYGGKAAFNQWEQDQRVTEPRLVAGDKVIFLNSSGMTYPMMAYTHNGEVVVDVPNKLLTMAVPVLMYVNGHHETKTSFNVVAQDKPEGYVFVDNDDWPSDNLPSVGAPKEINLNDYGIDLYHVVMNAAINPDGKHIKTHDRTKKLWEDITENPNCILLSGDGGAKYVYMRIKPAFLLATVNDDFVSQLSMNFPVSMQENSFVTATITMSYNINTEVTTIYCTVSATVFE